MSDSKDLFRQINNAVIDLQSADLQSYRRPLKKLGKLLSHEDLKAANAELTQGIDLKKFLEVSESSQGGMVGSAQLDWPDDENQTLGLQLLLILKFSEEPDYMASFGRKFFFSNTNKIMAGVDSVTSQLIIPFVREYKEYVENNGTVMPSLILPKSNRVFIVHGHDVEARETVARFLGIIGFEPIILNEQANMGRTIIEKIEANKDVGFAVVLLTPDDVGRANMDADLEPRARQNVLLELGYFMAHLTREKVFVLKRGHVAIPSDFAGVVWEVMDDGGGWKQKLGRELQAAGHSVDWNLAMR